MASLQSSASAACALRAVVVLFGPDDDALAFVADLAKWGYAPVVVVNAARRADRDRLEGAPDILPIFNDDNRGLALALNQGIEAALASGAEHVLLFDQDSRPLADLGWRLLAAARHAASRAPLGCVGPVIVDRKRPDATVGAGHAGGSGDLVDSVTVISSGMLIPATAIARAGGMWNELFIDQIDHEWCFRAQAAGLAVLIATAIDLPHDMGDAGFALFGAYKPIHRSPLRHYHIVRNTLWLVRRSAIPRQWRFKELLKLALRAPAYLLFSSARADTARSLARAVRDGLRSPPGQTYRASTPPSATAPPISPVGG